MADCSGFIQPLNLECLLVNTFAGSMEIFFAIAFIFIASMGAYFRMPNVVVLSFVGLFAIIFGNYNDVFYFLAVLVGAFIIAYLIGKTVQHD